MPMATDFVKPIPPPVSTKHTFNCDEGNGGTLRIQSMEYYSPKRKNDILNQTSVKFSMKSLDSQDMNKAGDKSQKKKSVKTTVITDTASTHAGDS